MEFNFKEIVDELKKQDIIYTSEAELQFTLMQIIKDKCQNATVRCEFEPDIDLEIEPNQKKVIRIDIVVFLDGAMYPIEVKFRKTGLSKKCYEGRVEILYHDQDAPDDAAYYYINDIHRIERFCERYHEKYPDMCIKGYTLFMTNQKRYKGDYNNRTAWKDLNIFKQEDKVIIPSSGKGRISGVDREYVLKQKYEKKWDEVEIQGNKFYYFWNEITCECKKGENLYISTSNE